MTRVRHRISGQYGTLISRGIWYAAVKFDGESGTSWVALDSLRDTSGEINYCYCGEPHPYNLEHDNRVCVHCEALCRER